MAGYKHLEIIQDFDKYVLDKKVSSRAYYRYLLSRLLRMFQYKNLPDTIPHDILDRYLFEYGICCITKVNDKLYCFYGNLGGPQDVYYRPTEFIVANPHIKTADGELFSANIPVFETDDKSVGQPTGVLIRNDTDWFGLHPLLARYAFLMAENTLTLRTADVMLRVIALLTAKTDAEKTACIEYLASMEKGKLGVIGESAFHEGVNLQSPPSQNGSYLTQFIEFQQYLKGSFFGDIGLSANYNMKREAIGKGESTLDQDALLPLAENMLKCRQEDLEKVNNMFGTDISVQFSSSWLTNMIETLSTLQNMSAPQQMPFANPQMSMGQPSDENGEAAQNDSSNNSQEDNAGNVGQNSGEESDAGNMEQNEEQESGAGNLEQESGTEVGTEAGTDSGNNSESRINDLSIDKEFTEILENVLDKNEEPENSEVQLVNPVKGGESDGEEESSETERDSSKN